VALERAHARPVAAPHVVEPVQVETAVHEQRLELARERDGAARVLPLRESPRPLPSRCANASTSVARRGRP